jgi:class 3 adenylate cyclase
LRWKTSFSGIGVTFGLTLALTSILSTGVGILLIGREVEIEERAYVQQSIGDTSVLLATHFKTEFEHFVEHLTEVGMSQIRPVILQTANRPTSLIGTMDTNPEILDISLWKREAQTSAFDLYPDPKQVYLAMNSRYVNPFPDSVQQVLVAESNEKTLVQPAFQGHVVVSLSPTRLGSKEMAIIAAPLGHGIVDEVVVAHLRLDYFQKVFAKEGMVSVILVDDFGNILAHPDPQLVGKKQDGTRLFQAMHASNLLNGQLNFEEEGVRYFGGYSRVGIGQLAILSKVAESEATSAFKVLGKQMALFLILCFLLFFVVGYFVYTRSGFLFYERRNEASTQQESHEKLPSQAPKQASATVIHGTLRHLNVLLGSEKPEDAAETLNDFFSLADSVVRKFGGSFERFSGHSFIAFWGVPTSDGTEVWCALRCALELRVSFFKLNEARKVDGQKALSFGMGVHTGLALAARIGTSQQMRYTLVGEAIHCAKALDQLTGASHTDLLVSQETWQLSDAKFIGEALGEAKLTQNTGLTGFFSVSGYRNEQGEAVTVASSMASTPVAQDLEGMAETSMPAVSLRDKESKTWLVNNGSQIVGPFSAREIATRLFAQELDFDCECWAAGTGHSAQIKNSGIFSGSEDQSASLWMYDGETIHGPISAGFVKTAVGHGAVQSSVYICEVSTVNGWKLLSEWDPALAAPASQDALRASLFPPAVSIKGRQESSPMEKKDQPIETSDPSKKAA